MWEQSRDEWLEQERLELDECERLRQALADAPEGAVIRVNTRAG